MRLSALGWLGLASGLGFAACGGDSRTAPSPTPPTTLFVLTAPSPLTPAPNAAIPQNDSATGCAVQFRSVGYGFRIEFSWAASQSSAGVDRYELVAAKVGASRPIVDTALRTTSYDYVSCDSYIADINLDHWEWKVRAVDVNGATSPWAAIPFRFLPCRVGRFGCSSS